MKDFLQSPCPICGKSEYSWGKFTGHGVWYQSDDASFKEMFFAVSKTRTKARHCDICGNVQIFMRDEVEENR